MQPLRREVEAPRGAAGLWAPIVTLMCVAMATSIVGVAVTARPPRARVIEQAPRPQPAIQIVQPVPEQCGQKVYRANGDGQAELYEICAIQQRGRGVESAGSDDGKIIRK